jgi:transposase
MPIVGGLDIHRKQITFDYLDTETGQVQRGQISPANRLHLQARRIPRLSQLGAAAIVWTGWFKNGGCRGQAADGEGRGYP